MARCPRLSLPVSSLALLLAVALAPRASASGFQLRDQSGSGQGNAFAGAAAGGEDISSMFWNPATLTRYMGNQLQFGVTEVMPSSKFSDGAASRDGSAIPIGGATSTGNIASSATLPTFYALLSVSPDFKLGLSVNVPFGLTTQYDPTWAGRYEAVRTHLETLDITPTVAYRMDSKWSAGFAFVARRAEAQLSQALDSGYAAQTALASVPGITNTSPSGQPIVAPGPGTDGFMDVEGSSWAYGYKLGLLFDASAKLHFGLGYQSAIRETIKGSASFTVPTGALDQAFGALASLPANAGKAGTIQEIGETLALQAINGPAQAVLNLPATLSFGFIYDVSGKLSLAGEFDDTKWSSFKELRVTFPNPSTQPDQVTAENWRDALFLSLGATYRPVGKWTYRAGVALDTTPVPSTTRTPQIPDATRFWASGGASYQFTRTFGMDAGYSHLFCRNSTVNLQGGSDPTDQAKFFGGNLSGTYKNSIDILAVQARLSF